MMSNVIRNQLSDYIIFDKGIIQFFGSLARFTIKIFGTVRLIGPIINTSHIPIAINYTILIIIYLIVLDSFRYSIQRF